MKKVRVRIAPSPTGYPHIGTVFQALINFSYAKKHQGDFLVRIEDTDQTRFVEDAEDAIFSALEWFGLNPDESPRHEGNFGPYRQSERLDIYQKYALQLISQGDAYRCFCSKERLDTVRKDMQKNGLPPMYDKQCLSLNQEESEKRSQTEKYVVRMKIPSNEKIICHDEIRGDIEFDSQVVDDQVILKSDGFPTYHLAVVVDDHLMEISHIVRGEEWISSSPKHILLYKYFNWDLPKFIHTPVLRNPDKSKLSKRHDHASVNWYIDKGYLKEAIINFLITRVWNHPEGKEIFGIDEIIKHFDFSQMHIQGPIVDLKKLDWINGQWIRSLDDHDLSTRLKQFVPHRSIDEIKSVLPMVKERLVTLEEFKDLTSFFFKDPTLDTKLILKESKVDSNETASYVGKVISALESIQEWNIKSIEDSLRKLQESVGWKPRPAFMTIRLALSGSSFTPPLFDVMEFLGKEITINRLSHAQKQLQ
jgi:glutamyl-tRNA synthetase